MSDRVIEIGNNEVNLGRKISYICTNCGKFTYDVDIECNFKLVNEDEIAHSFINKFPSGIFPDSPRISNLSMNCPYCKDSHTFAEIPRELKESAITAGKKGCIALGGSLGQQFGTDWCNFYIKFKPIPQYAKTKGLVHAKWVKITQQKDSTVLELDLKHVYEEYGDELVSPWKFGKGSHEHTMYQVDHIDWFPIGTYELWRDRFLEDVKLFSKDLPEIKKLAPEEDSNKLSLSGTDDDPFVPASGNIGYLLK